MDKGNYEEYLRTNIKVEWQKEYIDYTSLKNLITEMKSVISEENCSEKEVDLERNNSIITPPLAIDVSPEKLECSYLKYKGKYLKKFISALDGEIKRIYIFYTKLEKELYSLINIELQKRNTNKYSKIYFSEIKCVNELKQMINNLIKIAQLNENVLMFIDLNITGIKKVLSKFDKNFFHFFNEISTKFFFERLEEQNSDLSNFIEFKVIDEVSAILEDLSFDNQRKFNNFSSIINRNLSLNQSSNRESLIDDQRTSEIKRRDTLTVKHLLNDLNSRIIKLDELSFSFFKKLKYWDIIVKHEVRIIYNHFSNNKNKNRSLELKNQVNRPDQALKEYSNDNIHNIGIVLIHTAFYKILYYLIFPSILVYLQKLEYNIIYSGLIVSSTHLGELIATLISQLFVKKGFKFTLTFSVFLYATSQFIYCLAYHFNMIYYLLISRFLLGLGNTKLVNKKYLTDYVNNLDVVRYSNLYKYYSFIGAMLGFFINFMFLFVSKDLNFMNIIHCNYLTNPSWICFLLSLFFLIFICIFYTEPKKEKFKIYDVESDSRSSIYFENNNQTRKVSNEGNKYFEENKLEANQKKNENNDFQNALSDSYLVSKNIEKLQKIDSIQCSLIYKCLIVISLIIAITKIHSQMTILVTPFYLLFQEGVDIKLVSTVQLLTSFFIIPSYYVIQRLLIRYNERRLILYLLIISTLSCYLLLNFFYDNIIQSIIGYSLTLIFSNLLEGLNSELLVKLSYPNVLSPDSCFRITVLSFFSFFFKALGSCLITISGLIYYENINLISNTSIFSCLVIIFITFIFNYSEIRIKAISRLARK